MLKNYTSTVPASRSIASIERCLVSHGAKQIARTYEDGAVIGVNFVMEVEGKDTIFSLPARVANCRQILINQRVNAISNDAAKRILDQAERTAWKIVLDWTEAQMAMVDLAQIEMLEIFLPYVYDGSKGMTFFEQIKQNNYKALLPGDQ